MQPKEGPLILELKKKPGIENVLYFSPGVYQLVNPIYPVRNQMIPLGY